ncbi:MaoC/PaaZ C-terminal domain-containing protein [Glaciimonas sp. CA11.2]|uniref:MaoC/PaaZ C-terminal domain-containing protein n=1 Tax=unclassified Glaciimonas TaxID=2644401 RepID=UPI002AB53F95|nr:MULTISPECIES: MaoC/PaaZ C-terminal domain-containing protein [unclassified Glaciimonas]MDY7546124.1 MaoC/PaaZ C-terminal domain-containing protein [Glaciimonas sp. CA11.2]MEB0010921.1 MaoC/PaaZ C-terminal domain-containing protein [Glaciimonas sp. Cout2]MEB0081703.1 MaoC/PaaZ C-terminal domain-containing protein [Glaciimonas sp. Gout2]MEB0161820.1 MaoC/PaaZ C-terminal domain-containing protein [Glaciimonas sp. CA11.2]
MAINVDFVKNWSSPVVRQTYSEKDAILYALALGYGSQPNSPDELRFVYEKGMQAVPTLATTLCYPGFWITDPRTGIDASKAVHGEHKVIFHAPLPAKGNVRGQSRVVDLIDKGPEKGALLIFERDIYNDDTGVLLASIEHRTVCRADGGFSTNSANLHSPVASAPSPLSKSPATAPWLQRDADYSVDIASLPQASLIYRLSADPNPLHADPQAARAAGFSRPIMHGLCTYGIVARAIMAVCCENNADALKTLGIRFLAPVFPGETIRTEIWKDSDVLHYRCLLPDRNTIVIATGTADIA